MPPRSRGIPLSFPKHVASLYIALSRTSQRFAPVVCHCSHLPFTPTHRSFSATSHHLKKPSTSQKSARKIPEIPQSEVTEHIPNNAATKNRDAEIDPYDYTALQSDIDKALVRLKDALTKTRDAGRVSAQMIEDLPLELNVKGSNTGGVSARKEKTRVGDLASVVPKGGRSMQVFCSEEAHVKPITAAIQASPYSLTPQPAGPNDGNPLLITVPVPPVTAETRAQARTEAKKVMEKAALEVRTARGEAQKQFRRMELGKLVVQDELRKAHKRMEEVARKGQDEVKRVGDAAVKALER